MARSYALGQRFHPPVAVLSCRSTGYGVDLNAEAVPIQKSGPAGGEGSVEPIEWRNSLIFPEGR